MITECARCGNPLFPHMDRCSGCGAQNPRFEQRTPPSTRSVFTSDEGTEYGLLGLGLAGLFAGARLLLTKGAPAWAPWVAASSIVIGLAFLLAFQRVTVSDLAARAKLALRAAMVGVALLHAWVYSLTR